MTENKVCKGCTYNKYPLCHGTKMFDGNYMRIDALRVGFECGQKDLPELKDFSIRPKTIEQLKIEELEAKNIDLEARLAILESK